MKPNCYGCKFRRNVPGDCHSTCVNTAPFDKLNIQGATHGIVNGWFFWPINFDPVWLQNCDGFEPISGPILDN